MSFVVRLATPADAEGILLAQYSAIHVTAARDYDAEIIAEWSRPVTPERVHAYLNQGLPSETTWVAMAHGKVAGFSEIYVPNQELRAVYVHADFGGQGVGSALLAAAEAEARSRGCRELAMDSSITAARFYSRHGYATIKEGIHTLSSGRRMACVRMRKAMV